MPESLLEFVLEHPDLAELAELVNADSTDWIGICINLYDLGGICNEALFHATLAGPLYPRLRYKEKKYRLPYKMTPPLR